DSVVAVSALQGDRSRAVDGVQRDEIVSVTGLNQDRCHLSSGVLRCESGEISRAGKGAGSGDIVADINADGDDSAGLRDANRVVAGARPASHQHLSSGLIENGVHRLEL